MQRENSLNRLESLLEKEKKDFEEIKKKFELSKIPNEIGLQNIGATCYMNATLQCLSNINLLTGFFLFNKNYFSNISYQSPEKPISKAFSDVIYHLWNPNEPNKYYYFVYINL